MHVKPLKVVLVGPYPRDPKQIVGGTAVITSTLAEALAAQETVAEVSVLCFHRAPVPSGWRRLNDKLRVRILPEQRLSILTRVMLGVWRAHRVCNEVQPDIVHGQGIGRHGYIASHLNNSAVVTVHGMVAVEQKLRDHVSVQGRLREQIIDSMVTDILRRSSVVISTSQYDSDELRSRIRGHNRIIPNPIPPVFFENRTPHPGGFRLLFGGVLNPRKNVLGLLRAFDAVRQQVPEARLVLAGAPTDSAYAERIKTLVAEHKLGNATEFVGNLNFAQLAEQMRQAHSVVLFSNEETSPTILAQAITMGRPIVSSAAGGVGEMVIDGDNGFVVPVGDEQALAERLVMLLRSSDLTQRMAERSKELAADRWHPLAVGARTVDAYQLALAPAERAASSEKIF